MHAEPAGFRHRIDEVAKRHATCVREVVATREVQARHPGRLQALDAQGERLGTEARSVDESRRDARTVASVAPAAPASASSASMYACASTMPVEGDSSALPATHRRAFGEPGE